MASYESKISEFRSRISDIGKQLADLASRRKSFSLAAASGDDTAKQEISQIDFLIDAAHREEATISSAVESAIALDRQAQHEVEAAARLERERAAYLTARAIIALNSELDLALTQLKDQFARRAQLLVELGNSGAVDLGLIMRLSNRAGPTSAAALVGLSKYLNLEMTPTASQRPLADTNSVLLGIGSPPADADKPRVQGRNTRH